MALTMTTADKVLKEFYLAPVREQLNSKVSTLSLFEKNSTDIRGKRAYVPIHTYRNSGVGNIADGGALPDAGEQGYEDSLIPLRYSVGRFQVTGPTIRATRSDDGSFVRAISSEMKGVVRDLKTNLNRQVFGTSNGVIAQFGVTASGDVLALDPATTATQMRQIQRNMKISIGTVANPVVTSASLTVVSVQVANKTVTVAAGTGVVTAATDFLFRKGSGGATSAQKELTGLRSIVAASGAIFGVDPATETEWVSTVNTSGSNRQLTEDLIQKVSDDVEIASGEVPSLWIGSYGVVRSYSNLIAATKRIVNTVALKSGWTGVELAASGSAFAKDKDCPENSAFALSPDVIQEYRAANYDFADYDGRSIRNVAGYDAWEGFVVCDHELATSQRNAHALVDHLSE